MGWGGGRRKLGFWFDANFDGWRVGNESIVMLVTMAWGSRGKVFVNVGDVMGGRFGLLEGWER